MSEEKKKIELNIDEPEKKLEECEKLKNEYLAGWQRARADFLNYKKEEMERIGEIIKYANEEIILKILPILDNFELATRQNLLTQNLGGQEKINQVIDGFLQIKKQIEEFLKQQGIEEIEVLGKPFDANTMEAIISEDNPNSDEIASGAVVEEIQKGYTLFGKVIRVAKVKISK